MEIEKFSRWWHNEIYEFSSSHPYSTFFCSVHINNEIPFSLAQLRVQPAAICMRTESAYIENRHFSLIFLTFEFFIVLTRRSLVARCYYCVHCTVRYSRMSLAFPHHAPRLSVQYARLECLPKHFYCSDVVIGLFNWWKTQLDVSGRKTRRQTWEQELSGRSDIQERRHNNGENRFLVTMILFYKQNETYNWFCIQFSSISSASSSRKPATCFSRWHTCEHVRDLVKTLKVHENDEHKLDRFGNVADFPEDIIWLCELLV